MWPLLLSVAERTPRRITELQAPLSVALADLTSQQPHDDHEQNEDDEDQRHP
jgi:hypothetical protein